MSEDEKPPIPHGHNKGREFPERTLRLEEIKAVVTKLDADMAWDHLQARDLPPELIDWVAQALKDGHTPAEVTKSLGLKAGKNSKQWKKIQAYFRQGFRADAEAYLMRQTEGYFKIIEKAKAVLEDAFENGTPHVLDTGEVIHVRGATKELGSFLESYSKSIQLPVKLWKEFGAIGEKKDPNSGGLTIIVKSSVPRRSQEEVDAYRKKYIEAGKPVIDVTDASKAKDGVGKPEA